MNQQVNFEGEPAKPWDKVCCKACYNAKNDQCSCRCEGKYHGKGNEKTVATPDKIKYDEAHCLICDELTTHAEVDTWTGKKWQCEICGSFLGDKEQ